MLAEDEVEEGAPAAEEPAEMKHDDVVGEAVPEEEAMAARQSVMTLVRSPPPLHALLPDVLHLLRFLLMQIKSLKAV